MAIDINDKRGEHAERLRRMIPFNSLSPEGFRRVLEQIKFVHYDNKKNIFRRGDRDEYTLYLLSGQIELSSGDWSEAIDHQSDKALYPLSNLKPRRYSAESIGPVTVGRIVSNFLEKIIAWDQMINQRITADAYEVVDVVHDMPDSDDWMIRILRTPAFLNLPAANIQAILNSFEEIHVCKGDKIIQEGEEGDSFYYIKEGHCVVSRRSQSTGEKEIVCDQMEAGDAFGESALISGRPRNATITMASDGVLLRLEAKNFHRLMENDLVRWVDSGKAFLMKDGGASFIDVRTPEEFKNGSIPKSMNMPLNTLRRCLNKLSSNQRYIVFCDTGARSAAAAFLLMGEGFDVQVLNGGLSAISNSDGLR